MDHRDGFPDELDQEAASQDRRRADADLLNQFVWGASGDARRDEAADASQEGHQRDAGAEKSADRVRDARARDDAQWAARGVEQSAALGAAASALELCTRAEGRSAERSCAGLAELAAHAPAARLQLAAPELRVWGLRFALGPLAEHSPVQLERPAVAQQVAVRLVMAGQ